MNKAREGATKKAIELLSMLDGYNDSVKETESMFSNLTDIEFDKYMVALRDGTDYLQYLMPTMGTVNLSSSKNIKVAKKLSIKLFHRLWLTDASTGDTYLTPKEYLVMDIPFRRQQQHLQKKISIPNSNKRVDELTGQVTGSSKGSSLSASEMQILYSQGMNESIRELFKFRGGDETAHRNLMRNIINNNDPSMDNADDGISRPKSTETIGILLRAAHIDNNV
jgi:hypothetical protein